jgi:hypothetical protein
VIENKLNITEKKDSNNIFDVGSTVKEINRSNSHDVTKKICEKITQNRLENYNNFQKN